MLRVSTLVLFIAVMAVITFIHVLEVLIYWLLVICIILRSTLTDLLQVISASFFFVIESICVIVKFMIQLTITNDLHFQSNRINTDAIPMLF